MSLTALHAATERSISVTVSVSVTYFQSSKSLVSHVRIKRCKINNVICGPINVELQCFIAIIENVSRKVF